MDDLVGRIEVKPGTTSHAVRRRRGWLLVLIVLLLLLAGLVAWWLLAGSTAKQAKPAVPPQPVGAARIGTGDLHVVLSGLGTVTPLATITVQTQINGQLLSIGYREGQIVHKGDFLAQIDPRPYQAALEQAQGTLARDTGLLRQARSDLARYTTLIRQRSIAQQQAADQQFLVEQDQGAVLADQGTVDNAKVNLAYCHITAPVTGRVGLRLVDPGNYVQTSSSTGLVVLTQLQPISVIFVLPEDDVAAVSQQLRAGRTLPVEAYNRTDATRIATGTLDSVDNEVDTTTGTVKLRAVFANADEALIPNQFVNARLLVRTLPDATVAPVAAVQRGAPGAFVYRVEPGGTVGIAVVKTGITDNDQVQILSGVAPGDTVVVDGVDRLRDGAHVRITNDGGDPAATVNGGPGAPPGQQSPAQPSDHAAASVGAHPHHRRQAEPAQPSQDGH